jgi:hypothetical protein
VGGFSYANFVKKRNAVSMTPLTKLYYTVTTTFDFMVEHYDKFFDCELPSLALHGINGDPAGKCHFMDEARNPPEDWLYRWELLAQGRRIPLRNGIPPKITSSWKLIQTGKIKLREKSSKR